MEYITVNNCVIPFNITNKKNKNTYFYFKKQGYIQINLSRYQSKKEIIQYLKKNSIKFIEKLENNTIIPIDPTKEFYYLGKKYNISISDVNTLVLDEKSMTIHTPTTDCNSSVIKDFYKNKMYQILTELQIKYYNNTYVNISNIVFKTRYTNSRHGSCNAKKRIISINLNLMKFDVEFIEYVFLHEIAHLNVQHHGPDFYELLKKLSPNYKQLKKELRKIYR